MPKDNVSYELLNRNFRKLQERHWEKMYDRYIKILDPDGELSLAEADLSYDELMRLKDEVFKE